MTVSTPTSAIAYTSAGVTATYAYSWQIALAADLLVYLIDPTGLIVTKLALTTDYTVTGVGIPTGGTIVLVAGIPASGTRVFICSDPSMVQALLLQQGVGYNPADVMTALDLLTREVQQVRRLANNAVQVPPAESLDGYLSTVPPKAGRANTFMAWDVNGNIFSASGVSGVAVSSTMVPFVQATSLGAARNILGKVPAAVATIAALKALATTDLANDVFVEGYNAAGDFGGGFFHWNSADAAADNAGTVIIPNSAPGTGRWNRCYSGALDPRYFGAKADGTTNDRPAIIACEAAAVALGQSIVFSPGIYAVDNSTGRIGFRCNVRGFGATIKLTAVLDQYAGVSNQTQAGVNGTNITIEGLTVDANNLARSFYLTGATNCVLDSCKAKNCQSAGVGVYLSTDVQIIGCIISNVRYQTVGGTGQPADGIYFGGCVRPVARDNIVSDFRRIGIVSESESATRTSDARIMDNTVFNANNCDDSTDQFNSGIWCEHTNGSFVYGNKVSQIGGNAGQTSARVVGMILGNGDNASCTHHWHDNDISVETGAGSPRYAGLSASGSGFQSLQFNGNRVADCATGVGLLDGLIDVVIRDCNFNNIRFANASNGCVVIDCATTRIVNLTLDHLRFTNITDADAGNDASYIHVFSGYISGTFTINDVVGASLTHRGGVVNGRLVITNSSLSYGSATQYGCLKGSEVYCANVKWSVYAARSVGHFTDSAGGNSRFQFVNCQWDGAAGSSWGLTGANTHDATFTGCHFYNGVCLFATLTGATINVRFTGCLIDEFSSANGFFNTGGSTTAGFRVFFRGNDFTRSTDVTPIQKNSAQPAKSVFYANSRNATITALHDYAAPTQDVGTIAA